MRLDIGPEERIPDMVKITVFRLELVSASGDLTQIIRILAITIFKPLIILIRKLTANHYTYGLN